MLQQMLGAQHLDGSYWTLQVELFFYVQMLFWFMLGQLRRIRWIIVGVAGGGSGYGSTACSTTCISPIRCANC